MKREKILETILVLVIALVIGYRLTLHSSPKLSVWLLILALTVGGIGLFIPALARLIHTGWMSVSHAIGFVMSKLLLSLIFVVIVIPLAFLSGIFGKRNVIKMKKGSASYFTERNFTYTGESMENVW